jgi:hypothetical protein
VHKLCQRRNHTAEVPDAVYSSDQHRHLSCLSTNFNRQPACRAGPPREHGTTAEQYFTTLNCWNQEFQQHRVTLNSCNTPETIVGREGDKVPSVPAAAHIPMPAGVTRRQDWDETKKPSACV